MFTCYKDTIKIDDIKIRKGMAFFYIIVWWFIIFKAILKKKWNYYVNMIHI